MILLLPDFIGHPSCFQSLLSHLPEQVESVNYHTLAMKEDLSELADLIADGLKYKPTWIIGYSFGGALGYELCQRNFPTARLVMVDSHLPSSSLREMPIDEQYQHWLTTDIQDWLSLMQELNEIKLPVILNNISLFSQWQPKPALQQAWWIRSTRNNINVNIDWHLLIQNIHQFDASVCHHEVMKESNVISYLIQLTQEVTFS
ncbi:thioesterase domain-containing protein [Xenorhabdus griffiniae]|uniref:thioesterase domain-containing protein n=1 Tax=Xenorhabdus griffiniae TaxID=351672 RepID=UPI0023593068|nr:thioesterase domain-containing protein [Xenorhabdus griffiniae]MDC9605583.1 thioesterase domain-containing protein [Xenorhabdus griffiniae]